MLKNLVEERARSLTFHSEDSKIKSESKKMVAAKKQILYWKNSAKRDFGTATDLFKTKHYDACLFFCHLTLEKILKALVIQKTNQPAPYVHDLEKLSLLARLSLTKTQIQNLKTISTFNIAARYDNIKLAFYKKCTKIYAQKYLGKTEQLYLWLQKEFLKK